MDYKYRKVNVPEETFLEARKLMPLIGCRTMPTFVTLALKDYFKKIQSESQQAK